VKRKHLYFVAGFVAGTLVGGAVLKLLARIFRGK
jgi:hypothetical protein